MGLKNYFFDSYAVIELTKGNPRYLPYLQEVVIITIFNLVEIVYSIRLDHGAEKAGEAYEKFRPSVQEVDKEIILEALEFKAKHKQRHLSYADCIGYVFAQKRGLHFLTGDKEFKEMPNVEFMQ